MWNIAADQEISMQYRCNGQQRMAKSCKKKLATMHKHAIVTNEVSRIQFI